MKNAEGETVILDGSDYYGTMDVYDEYMTIEDEDEQQDNFSITYTVPNSDRFTFFPEASDLFVSVTSPDICTTSETAGASYVLISKDDGVTAYGSDVAYSLSISVNNALCDLVTISGRAAGDVKLTKKGGTITATGADALGTGSVEIIKNTVDSFKYSYRSGYSSFIVSSDGQGGAMIIGSTKNDGVYDTNITLPYGVCAHEWGGGEVTTAPTYTAAGERTYTCPLCGETRTEEIPMLDPLPGDVNGDCKLNSRDLSLLKRYVAGAVSDDDVVQVNVDIDGDGKTSSRDISALKKRIAEG